MLLEGLREGTVVERDTHGVIMDPDIAFQCAEEVLGQMRGVPVGERRGQTLAQHVRSGLCEKSQTHPAVADVQVQSPGPIPPESLFVIEKGFDVPALRIVLGEGLEFIALGGAEKRFELPLVGTLACPLDELDELGVWGGAESERLLQGRIPRPVGLETLGGQGAKRPERGLVQRHRDEQVKGPPLSDRGEQLDGVVFAVGHNQRSRSEGLEDFLSQPKQLGSGPGNRPSGRSGSKTQGLRTFGIETEKRLGHFAGGLQAVFAQAEHLPLSCGVQAMGIQRQQSGGKVPQGATDLPQRHLQSLGLLQSMSVQHPVDRGVRGDKGQAIEQLETALAERAVISQSIQAQRRFVDQLQSQASRQVGGPRGRPTLEQFPRAQPQVLGNQEPKADQVAINLVGQKLPDLAFEASGVGGLLSDLALGALRTDGQGGAGRLIEFFFVGHTPE